MQETSAKAQSRIVKTARPVLCARPFETDVPDWRGPALAEDVLNEAVRLAQARALSHHSTFQPAFDSSPEALTEMGVRHVLRGRFTPGNLSELSLTLDDLTTAKAQTVTVEGATLQALADGAAQKIAGMLTEAQPPRPDWITPPPRAAEDPTIFAKLCQARHAIWSFDRTGNEAALALVDEVLSTHPDHPAANGYKAFLLTRAYRSSWIMGRDTVAPAIKEACARAWKGDPQDPAILWTTAFAQGMIFRDYPLAADLVARAAALQPHASHILGWGSLFMTYDLEFETGLAYARRALAISPLDPMRVTHGFAGALAAIHGGQDAAAVELSEVALTLNPTMKNALRIKASALFHLGETEKARACGAQVLKNDPKESVALAAEVNPLREWPGFSRFLDGLAGAGLP
ncbi:tetratricopeptide repeat protein [Thalassorhabdomicrobium marinisediminis]|uniref:tetratricopeptide repeat protein n=1 Tax=Thalassorhabdomicrobium marinisediminis TaxID=2170577 RepID=UPI00249077D3|nr:tetratricopeptide repeat protein [Thalassorhabdomicrobium marinisediminis]